MSAEIDDGRYTTYTATMALRWIARQQESRFYRDGTTISATISRPTYPVLQQAWQGSDGTVEWRDVPFEPNP